MRDFFVVEKEVGQTPLAAIERVREREQVPPDVSLAYAGRLDPMASGKLLVLAGDECKKQEHYHGLDKEYEFTVLFGVSSDSGDVLGLISSCNTPDSNETQLREIAKKLTGPLTLPYPAFSSKTVQGKPLHTWTLEGRLHEIEIPTYTANVFSLKLHTVTALTIDELYTTVCEKIETIPPVTDERKALGNDFRRADVRASWKSLFDARPVERYTLATFRCICSSGTYMRTLAEVIAKEAGTCGLAYAIHRNKIGRYQALPFGFGFWKKQF